jgi:hypothetical protein
LTRALQAGELITADQTEPWGENGDTAYSPRSINSVPVTTFSGTLGKPTVDKVIYECGHIVPVDGLVESSNVAVFADAQTDPIGQEDAPEKWIPVFTSALVVNQSITARQTLCTASSDPSDGVPVKASPASIPTPKVVSAIFGSDRITVTNLLTGALIEVSDVSGAGTVVGGGYATAATNWVPLSVSVTNTPSLKVTQKLCEGAISEPAVVTASGVLPTPVLVDPIYDQQQFVFIRKALLNATLAIYSSSSPDPSVPIAFGGGTPEPDGALALALVRPVVTGEVIHAAEYLGSAASSDSNSVTVSGAAAPPTITYQGSEPYFTANTSGGEQQIDGPVYPRARGLGPIIQVATGACSLGVNFVVTRPGSVQITHDTLTAEALGRFPWQVPWASLSLDGSSGGILAGKYTVDATNNCNNATAQSHFYVIFDPQEVGGPDVFSFQETGIWFGVKTQTDRNDPSPLPPGQGGDYGMSFALHIKDARVFGKAIAQVNGVSNQYLAMQKLLTYEAGMFGFATSSYHEHDVLKLLGYLDQNPYLTVQCFEDANMLVALLRSVGIPSHPVTGDAASGNCKGWDFDTWVEAKAVGFGESAARWWAMHSHQEAGALGPSTRAQAGDPAGTWSSGGCNVASKETNDDIFMANEGWVNASSSDFDNYKADITYQWNSCGRPAENFSTKAAWVDHMCVFPADDNYWGVGHWECDIQPSTSALTISVDGPHRVGDVVNANVTIDNPTATDKQGTLNVIIAINDILTMIVPDAQFDLGGLSVTVPSGTNQVYGFTYTLPVDLSSANAYSIVATTQYISGQAGDSGQAPFFVDAFYDMALDLPTNLQACAEDVDCSFNATLHVANTTSVSVTDLNFDLSLPFGVQTPSGGDRVTLHEDRLAAGAEIVRTIPLKIVAPNQAAHFVLSATTADGGAARKSRMVAIDPVGVTIFTVTGVGGVVPLNQPPVAACHDVTVAAGANCQATVTAAAVNNGSYDPDGPPPTCTLGPNGQFGLGATPVTLTCVDAAGASASCTATVTVVDTTPPAIVCPANVTAECNSPSSATGVSAGAASATDICSTATVTNPAVASYPLGVTMVSHSAKDAAGNTATCLNTIAVVDTTPPAITCPANVTVECNSLGKATGVSAGVASATEICSTATVTNPAVASYPLGMTMVSHSAKDAAGNTATCSNKITVVDTTPPAIACPANVIVECNSPGKATGVSAGAASATDICSTATVTNPAVASYPLGATTVSHSAKDGNGNTASCTNKITVVDTTPPVLTIPGNKTITTCADSLSVSIGQASATDVCSNMLVPTGQVIAKNGVKLTSPIPVTNGQATLGPGTYTVQWSVSDASNPPVQASQTVTVGAGIEVSQTFLVDDRAQVRNAAGGYAAVLNSGTGSTRVGQDCKVGGIVSQAAVTVQHRSVVSGSVVTGGKVTKDSDATITGTITENASVSLPALPTLPSFPAPTLGGFTVNAGTTVTKSPGSYSSVTIINGGTLILKAGDYYFQSLTINSGAILRVTPTTRVFVQNALTFNSPFLASSGSTVQPIFLGFAGTSVNLYAVFNGTLVAPNASVKFGSGTALTFTGSFFGRQFELTPGSALVCGI